MNLIGMLGPKKHGGLMMIVVVEAENFFEVGSGCILPFSVSTADRQIIQNKDLRFYHYGTGNGYALLLTLRIG